MILTIFPDSTPQLIFNVFCRYLGRQASRFGASGLHLLTPKRERKKGVRVYAGGRGRGASQYNYTVIYPGVMLFQNQSAPALPKGTVVVFSAKSRTGISQLMKIACAQCLETGSLDTNIEPEHTWELSKVNVFENFENYTRNRSLS